MNDSDAKRFTQPFHAFPARPALALAVLVMVATGMSATSQQAPPHTDAARTGSRGKVLLENDRVLVSEGIIAPGAAAGVHKHPLPVVVICMEGATIKETLPDGTSVTYDRKPGDVIWRDAGLEHNELNIGKTRLRIVAVQLKQ